MIKIGDRIPAVEITVVLPEGVETLPADRFFAGRKAVVFGLPGAFTPTCSASHLPGYVVLADEFKARGVDAIVCVSVNDFHVMRAWGAQNNAEQITLVADAAAGFTQALGLDEERPDLGGTRSQRYAMIVEDGVVRQLNVEVPKQFEVSDARTMLAALGG